MKEDINVRIIKKLKSSKYEKNVSEFLVNVFREEFAKSDFHHWSYAEVYDRLIKKYADSEGGNKC